MECFLFQKLTAYVLSLTLFCVFSVSKKFLWWIWTELFVPPPPPPPPPFINFPKLSKIMSKNVWHTVILVYLDYWILDIYFQFDSPLIKSWIRPWSPRLLWPLPPCLFGTSEYSLKLERLTPIVTSSNFSLISFLTCIYCNFFYYFCFYQNELTYIFI